MALRPPPHSNRPSRPPNASDEALQRAAFALQSQRPDEAARIAGDLLNKYPDDVRAMGLLGTALLMQGRGKDAVAPLEQLARRTNNPAAETQLAMALRQAGRNEEAVAHFESALKRVPPFPPAFLEFGNLLAELGRDEQAIEVLKRGLVLAPMFADLSRQLGRIYAERKNHAEARNAFARALELTPDHTDTMFDFARLLQVAGDFVEAAQTYRRLLAIEPNDAASQIGLGICLIELGRKDEGMANIRRAAQTNPKMHGEVLTALASCGHGQFWLRPVDAKRSLGGQ